MHASGQYVLRLRAGSHDKWNVLKDSIFVCSYGHWVPWTELFPAWMVMRGVKDLGLKLCSILNIHHFYFLQQTSCGHVRPCLNSAEGADT
jgi:hypothetical protein